MSEPSADGLSDLFENAPCALLSLDDKGRIVRCNGTLSAWTGYPREHFVGRRLADIFTVSGRIFYETHFAPMLVMSGAIEEVALELAIASKGRVPVLVNAVQHRSVDGQSLSTSVAIVRATERRRYERELLAAQTKARTLQKEIEAANAVLGQRLDEERDLGKLREEFVAVLGHDLRNPLASIRGGARLLSREPQSERAKTVLALIDASAVRMSVLIDNVLDFARGRLGGGITLDRDSAQPLEETLLLVVDELRSSTGRRIDTDFTIQEPVDCDRSRIAQMVSNLLGNALTHGAEDLPIKIIARSHDGELAISVVNGGAPIPGEAMENLFQPFFRGGSRRSTQGLGLGLHIALEIAKAHGGTLTVASSATETSFTFRMSQEVDAPTKNGSQDQSP